MVRRYLVVIEARSDKIEGSSQISLILKKMKNIQI